MKKFLFGLLTLWCCLAAKAQVYNNEWIDYAKTYYKIKVGTTGLHRISKATLETAGMTGVPAQHFQLWRNGVEVPIFTSSASGALPDGGFIEFWGERNDGRPDRSLYRRPEYQLNEEVSLLTDTAVYFLTINPAGNNRRLTATENNLSGGLPAPVDYFIYTIKQGFRNQLNAGYAADVVQLLYSSAYDIGEGYASANINSNATNALNLGNLFVATQGPAARFKISVSGNRNFQRRYRVSINADSILGKTVDFFNASTDSAEVPLSVIAGANNNVQVTNVNPIGGDRMVIHKYELSYPRQFNFGNATSFDFNLPASNVARYLEITNFNSGGVAPVLIDLTNGRRYLTDISVAGKVRVLIQPSGMPQRLVLYSQVATNATAVAALTQRRFIDYSKPENQGNYLIISNQLLFNDGSGGNAVEEYRQYRSSAAGGSYNTKIYEVDELTDQFGFGIKKTPLAIRNFILFTLSRFAEKPRQVFLLGKGLVYTEQRGRESDPLVNRLNLVPTFGSPASDVLLAAAPGTSVPLVSIGRLAAINAGEIRIYLTKVKQYEESQNAASVNPEDKLWHKNVAHIIGSGDANLQNRLEVHMSQCKDIVSDTLWGANVFTFTKKSGNNVEQISDKGLEQLFQEGISLITYFGHSSSSGLDYNLDNPDAYSNTGKYPVFLALGCQAGDFFGFSTSRFTNREIISEKYMLAPQKGTIGFIANTHFGVVSTLRTWNTAFYQNMSTLQYGKTLGEILAATAAKNLAETLNGEENYYTRVNIEETALHGDPALKLNVQPKPDYVLTEPMVRIEPEFVSIAESFFKLKVDLHNIGKAIKRKLVLSIKRQYPDGSEKEIVRDSVAAPLRVNALEYRVPVDAIQDKGLNKLTLRIDAGEQVDEMFETNNSATKEVFIYEDEARPIFPYNFAIVNKPDFKLVISTANPFVVNRQYRFELDTTELFNSPLKWSRTLASPGGIIEVAPGVSMRNNTVYYWRVAVVPENNAFRWNNASFVFLEQDEAGYNQSHDYQHFKSAGINLSLDSTSRTWRFGKERHNIFARNAIFPTGGNQDVDFSVTIDGDQLVRSACVGRSLNFTVLDAKTFKPWRNVNDQGQNLFLYGSGSANCNAGRQNNFEFSYMTAASRKLIMDFMDLIPTGSIVVIRSFDSDNPNSFSATWQKDTVQFGKGNSLYHRLLDAGFTQIDSINKVRAWLLIYQKGKKEKTRFNFTEGNLDRITLQQDFDLDGTRGQLLSPEFGPAKAWKTFRWVGEKDHAQEYASASILGVKSNGAVDTLFREIAPDAAVTNISSIDVKQYPYLKLMMRSLDTVQFSPYQLKQWRLSYDPVPEGAVAPNLFFQMKDSLEIGEVLDFKVAFKNISNAPFDSVRIKMVLTDRNNVQHVLPVLRHKPLGPSDTVHVRYPIDSRQFAGANILFVQVNPDNDQPEQYSYNNFLYHNLYVKPDQTAPLVDVTFDNIHILNRDIVSSKPDILIKLKDESRRLLLNDSSLVTVKVRNLATNNMRTYNFGNDTLRFVPAASTTDNVASAQFKPYFPEDGEYELIVSGKDRSGNQAGGIDYQVSFQVINKPMISNMLNYPNPFTTSTAFVFTLTGSEVPQNLKIQILTVTGKVVREITRQELGTLRIGRNITEFKWDGTDQYGQKLGNGVYLYRVVAQLGGKSLEKYKAAGDQTDQYFNKGYGKMYLMR